jgi:deferrochelatase/peroxidase EfeB
MDHSGAPVQVHPDVDCKEDARLNDFDYPLNNQFNCPFESHIRKTKSRGMVDNRDKFDIMRRGIPCGPEVGPDEKEKTNLDHGILFTCYQTSLSNGFHFIKNRKTPPTLRNSTQSLISGL